MGFCWVETRLIASVHIRWWSLSVAKTIWFWLGRDAINRVCTYLFVVVERSRNDMVLAGQRRTYLFVVVERSRNDMVLAGQRRTYLFVVVERSRNEP